MSLKLFKLKIKRHTETYGPGLKMYNIDLWKMKNHRVQYSKKIKKSEKAWFYYKNKLFWFSFFVFYLLNFLYFISFTSIDITMLYWYYIFSFYSLSIELKENKKIGESIIKLLEICNM